MFLIIAGGGNVGYHLLKHQISESNEVVVIETDPGRCSCISEELGNLVINGDACDPMVLEKAGIARAEMIVACTEKDQDNLVICQIARKKFHVPYTIALANDPSNLELFRKLGVDAAVSAIDAILNRIEQNIAQQEIMVVLARESDADIVRTRLTTDSPVIGKTLKEISFPEKCIVSAIIREGKLAPALPDQEIKPEDILITLLPESDFFKLKEILLGEETSLA